MRAVLRRWRWLFLLPLVACAQQPTEGLPDGHDLATVAPAVSAVRAVETVAFALPLSASCAAPAYWGHDGACSPNPAALAPWIAPADGKLGPMLAHLPTAPVLPPTYTIAVASEGPGYELTSLAVLVSPGQLVVGRDDAPLYVSRGSLILVHTDRPVAGVSAVSVTFSRTVD